MAKKKMSMREFIRKHRGTIDDVIKRATPNARINDEDRRDWVANDEGLYNLAIRCGVAV